MKILLGILSLVLCLLSFNQAFAGTSYFHGKTLTIIVPYSPGGGHDTLARLESNYLAKYVGAKNVKVVNEPGGGGIRGDNAIYSAKPNGLTIGVIDTGGIFAQILKQPGVHFNMSKYSIFGSPDFSPHVFLAHPHGHFQSFSSLIHAHKPVTVLATGKGGAGYELADLILDAFNIPHKMVGAFKGQHNVISAFLSGDGNVIAASIRHVEALGNKVSPLMMVSDTGYSKLPNVPPMTSEEKKAHVTGTNAKLLHTFAKSMFTDVLVVGPPGIPTQRIQALRAALEKTVHDSSYRAAARKAHDVPQFTSGAKMQMALTTLVNYSSTIRQLAHN